MRSMGVHVQRPVRLVANADGVDVGMMLPNGNEWSVGRHIKRVTRLTQLGKAQAQHVWKECCNLLASVHVCAVIAPGAHHCSTLLG